jgi:threonine aldolase
MTIYSFLDDYSEGCHPAILDALQATNLEQQTAYGNDKYSIEARSLIAQACGIDDVAVHFVSGGTLANLLLCAAALRPHEAVISATSGHIALREAGAIEATGHKIITMASDDGRLTPDAIHQAVAGNAQAPHMAKPRMVYVSNATEFGTVYSLSELTSIRVACDDHDLLLMVDGARLGVALHSPVAGGLTLASLAQLADGFWIGGTKAGTLFGEAIVLPNTDLAHDFGFHLKQRGALLAKGRSLGVQFRVLFGEGLFEQASATANAAAQRLAGGIVDAGFELAADTESNQVFAKLPNHVIEALQPDFSFYVWEALPDDRSVVRLVTSWATPANAVDRFIAALS